MPPRKIPGRLSRTVASVTSRPTPPFFDGMWELARTPGHRGPAHVRSGQGAAGSVRIIASPGCASDQAATEASHSEPPIVTTEAGRGRPPPC